MYAFESVTDLIEYSRGLIENDDRLSNMSVTGEISGFKRYASGHCYFSIKDEKCTLSCIMYNFYAGSLDFTPEDGLRVTLIGSCGIYPQQGKFQFYCKHMVKLGKGDLRERFKELFDKLSKEGLFDPSHKRPIPAMPRRIGVITSPSGAVIHDIINTLRRRNPFFDLTLFPASVQGENAPRELIAGLDYFSFNPVDVIIIGRGGGSLEDLFCFNDEGLVRRIYDMEIPVISAVGHEVDFTLCDYVSDLRVPTPTAAAEVVLPKFDDSQYTIMSLRNNLDNAIAGYMKAQHNRLNALRDHKALSGPEYTVRAELTRVQMLRGELTHIMNDSLRREHDRMNRTRDRIELLNPMNILDRGYAIVFDKEGRALTSGSGLAPDDELKLRLRDSEIDVSVKNVKDMGGS